MLLIGHFHIQHERAGILDHLLQRPAQVALLAHRGAAAAEALGDGHEIGIALGRADAIAAGDLALQESARLLLDLPERPNEKAFRAIAAPWSPWRGVAARMLWVYYRRKTGREGMP